MTLAKVCTLLALAALWIFVGLLALFFTLPLWGMSIDAPLPSWLLAGAVIWFGSYVALAVGVIRAKKLH